MQKEIAFYSRKEEKEEEKTENHHNNLKVITPSPFSAFAFNAVLKVFRVTLGSSPLKVKVWEIGGQESKNKERLQKKQNKKLLVLFFRILKDVE